MAVFQNILGKRNIFCPYILSESILEFWYNVENFLKGKLFEG